MRTLVFSTAFLCAAAQGAVYNITLVTDNVPDTTDTGSYLRSILTSQATDQDKAVAIWRWARRIRRQTSNQRESGKWVFDIIHNFNSYGTMNCSGVASCNVTAAYLAGVLGLANLDGRKFNLTDHTIYEANYDGEWHLFDSSMSIFCYRHDGVVASCDDVKSTPASCPDGYPIEQYHYYYYHAARQCASHPDHDGWRCAADRPVDHQRTLENGATSYASFSPSTYTKQARWGRRYILNLRPCQHYTRYWRMLQDFPPSGDCFRPCGSETYDNPSSGYCGNCRGNGLWAFEPDLTTNAYRDAMYDESDVESVGDSGDSPALHPGAAGQLAYVVFKVDAANVITSMDIEGSAKCASATDSVKILVSKDTGINWTEVWSAAGTGNEAFNVHLRDEVAGHTEALVKVEMQAQAFNLDCGLDSIKATTVTQVNRNALPALALGTNTVHFRLGEQTETAVLWPTIHTDAYLDQTIHERSDLQCEPNNVMAFYKCCLRAEVNNVECYGTWKLTVPTDVTGVSYHTSVCTKAGGDYTALRNSWDGSTFTEFFRKSDGADPMDLTVEEHISSAPAGTREVYYQMACFTPSRAADYFAPGIHDVVMEVRHAPRDARFYPVEVTYCWTEHRNSGDVSRTHTELVTSSEHEWTINVAGFRDPTMNWVRLNLKGHGPDGDTVQYGYSDGQDVGNGYEYQKIRYLWEWKDNVAEGKTYTASRASYADAPDSGGTELTNGKVVPPSEYFRSSWPSILPQATSGWEWMGTVAASMLTVDVDLEAEQNVQGVRVCTQQPDTSPDGNGQQFCHPAQGEIYVSTDGITWSPVGTIDHNDLWKPPGDYAPAEYDGHADYVDLPAEGRLAYYYPLAFPTVPARYVRFVFTPLEGKGMGISELQVFTAMSTENWPDDITLPAVSAPTVDATGAPLKGAAPHTVTFDATASGGTGPYTYDWVFGDGGTSTDEDPVYPYTTPGVYRATVIATDAAGEFAWAEVRVAVTLGAGQTVSGVVTGDVQDGVTLTLSGDEDATTTSAGGGSYSFAALAPGSYVVTPSLAGYIFTPASANVTVVDADVPNVDFVAQHVWSVSGTVTGDVQEGVTLDLAGDAAATTTSAAGGSYSFDGLVDGSYTVTPLLSGYVFAPPSQDVTVAGADFPGVDFVSHRTYTISGTVSGDVQGGVTLDLTGDATASTTSAGDGTYSFTGIINGSYTVTPTLAGYVFTPPSRDVTVAGADVTGVDFVAGAVYSVSGAVTGDVQEGVTMALSGDATDTTVTASDGSYSFDLLPDGSYIVTPSLAGYTFSPATWAVTVNGSDVGGIDFVASATSGPVRDISGVVTGDVQEGVTVTLSGDADATTASAADGSYSFSGLYDGKYFVTPSLAGYSFTPGSWGVTVSGVDVTGMDFEAVLDWADGGGGGCGAAAAVALAALLLGLRRRRGS